MMLAFRLVCDERDESFKRAKRFALLNVNFRASKNCLYRILQVNSWYSIVNFASQYQFTVWAYALNLISCLA